VWGFPYEEGGPGKVNALTKLFEPIKIGPLELPNRIIMTAVTTYYDFDSLEGQVQFFSARARGGAGLITVGALQTLYPGKRSELGAVNAYSDEDIPRLREITGAIRGEGGRSIAQLATYGYWARGGEGETPHDVAPSAVELPLQNLHPRLAAADFLPKARALSAGEVRQIIEEVGRSAVRVAEAGFDAIELQAVGGNLLNRFINPFTNQRTDRYGGSLQNRMRFVLEIIGRIKEAVGRSFPLVCRIPGDELVPFGLKLEEWKQIAPLLEEAGAHALSIMPGWHESRLPRVQSVLPRGSFVHLAEGIKQVVRIPVAAGNNINDPLLAERILTEGRADLIAMARPLIADPDLPNKAKEGSLVDIRLCTRCNYCFECLPRNEPVRCAVNAMCGREGTHAISPAESVKNITVIGGGPAGMEAARVAALRRHRVTLLEKEERLGGQLIDAALPPHKGEWKTLIEYLSTQLRKLGVFVRLGEEATLTKILETGPDAVIVATGAVQALPSIPGIDGENVVSAIKALRDEKETGEDVVIVGGGSIGCETAEHLVQHGKKVMILEMLPLIGSDIGAWNRWLMIERLVNAGVRMETRVRVEEITRKGVWVARNDRLHEFFEGDTVVIAAGMVSVNTLAGELEGKVPELHLIGDALKPRRVKEAVEEGFLTGLKV
jgi:2,4-dienoyl-CoA reductase (NADPH2)